MLRDRIMMARTLVTAQAKRLFAWGLNSSGQVGDNTTISKSSPVQIGTTARWTAIGAGGSHSLAVQGQGSLWSWGEGFQGQLGYPFPDAYSNSISGNRFNDYAIKADSTLWVWGGNPNGELGLSDAVARSSPAQVGTLTSWAQVSGGFYHVQALDTSNRLWGWGMGDHGRLGDDSTIDKSSPVQIGTLATWLTVRGGHSHSVAVKNDSTLWAWGYNDDGYQGSNDRVNRSSPTQVGTLATWSTTLAATLHTLILKTDSTLWAWGYNFYGELGNNINTVAAHRSSPLQVGTLATWGAVAAGRYHSVATKTDSTLWAWGYNQQGQLGLPNNTTHRSSPTQVGTLATWLSVFAGRHHSMALKTDSTLWAWGYNGSGQLGNGLGANLSSPVQIGTLANWTSVAGGLYHSLARNSDKIIYSWGVNGFGQVGDNSAVTGRSSPVQIGTTGTISPVQVGTLMNWRVVSGGSSHSVAIKTDSTLWGWGKNSFGQVGDNSSVDKSSPVQLGSQTWSVASAGGSHSLAVRANSTLWSWGSGSLGQLGKNGDDVIPEWSVVSAGGEFTLGRKTDSSLWAWGTNVDGGTASGHLGDSTSVAKSSPAQIGTLKDWLVVSAGGKHSVAVKTNSTLWTWGTNAQGRMGDGTTLSKSSPVMIGTLADWLHVSSGASHSVALKTDSTLWAWGAGSFGRLGDNETSNKSSPVQVGTLAVWRAVVAGNSHNLALKNDSTLWVWGTNFAGQIGDGTLESRSSPVQIGTLAVWADVFAGTGTFSSFATKTDSTLWAWGLNNNGGPGATGILGDSTTLNKSSPTQIGTLARWRSIEAAFLHAVALQTDSTLWSWGSQSSDGVLGDSTNLSRSSPAQIGTLVDWQSVAVGGAAVDAQNHSLRRGVLYSWGRNTSTGALGDNTAVSKSSPVQIGSLVLGSSSPIQVGTLAQWSSVVAATSNSLALKTDSTLWTWGSNTNGQLGRDNLVLPEWSFVVMGDSGDAHAVKTDSTLWAWGAGSFGRPGDGTTTDKSSPVQVGTLQNWSSLASGQVHSIALKTNGTLFAWGEGAEGKLGDNTTVSKSSPVQVGTLATWGVAATGRSHSLALKTDNTLWVWGLNSPNVGQLGLNNSATDGRSSPVQIGTLATWSYVAGAVNSDFSLALKTDSTIWSWGGRVAGAMSGQLGDNATNPKSSPAQIGTLAVWRAIEPGASHGLALKTDSTLWAWGYNAQGQLGDGTTVPKSSPVQVGTLATWATLFPGDLFSFAIKTDSTLWAWGRNASGHLGDGTTDNKSSPVQIGTLANWTSGSAGSVPIALQGNRLFAWGNNGNGNVGDNTTINKSSPVLIGTPVPSSSSPTQIGTLATWRAIGGSGDHYLAVKTDSTLWAWGLNTNGRIGDGTTLSKSSPAQIGTLAAWGAVGGGNGQSLAVKTDGTLWAWGYNQQGQLGLPNNTTHRSSPAQVGTLATWSLVSGGGSHDLATTL